MQHDLSVVEKRRLSKDFEPRILSCIEQTMSRLALTVVKSELSSNLLVPHAYTCRVFVCFVRHIIIFFWQRQTN